MLARPTVAVFDNVESGKVVNKVPLASVCQTPVRLDIVQFVHDQISKNIRQAHGVAPNAGMQHAAESWGTGRAVARIPRVTGSGTHRSGQGAFGNMCRKGRMFAPLKTWRRWHRKVNIKQKRHAVASALAAAAVTPLVIARGHRISQVPFLPLVVDNKVEAIEKTRDVVSFLKKVGAYEDVERVLNARATRPGQGKLRYHGLKIRKGPLFIYSNENAKIVQAVRNVPGVDICNVSRLNLKQLAPGGHLGRFCIFTESAFSALDNIFGTDNAPGTQKSGYHLHKTVVTNPDISKIINSNEVQSAIRDKKQAPVAAPKKINPYTNKSAMEDLNPHRVNAQRIAKQNNESNKKKRQEALKSKRGIYAGLTTAQKKTLAQRKKSSNAYINSVLGNLEEAYPEKVDPTENLE